MRTWARCSAVVMVALGLVGAACGDDDDGGGASTELVSGDDFSVVGALHEIPDEGGADFDLMAADLATTTELLGLDRPSSTTDERGFADWLIPLTSGRHDDGEPWPQLFLPLVDPLRPQRGADDLVKFDETVGWSLLDVDAAVTWSAPPGSMTVVAGDLDDQTLPSSLAEVSDGVVTDHDGDDLATDFEQLDDSLDRLGRPSRLAYDDGRIALGLSTPMVEEWLAGSKHTLAEDDGLAAIAGALDDADVVSAYISRHDFSIGGAGLTPRAVEQIGDDLPDVDFDTVGVGWAVDDAGDGVVTIVYDAGSADDAGDLVDQLEDAYDGESLVVPGQRVDDRLRVRDIVVDGRVVAVTADLDRDAPAQAPLDMMFKRDQPFVHR